MFDINVVILNGDMTAPRRAAVIERFKTDPTARLLLMSSVGMVGLNLVCADVVIAYVSDLIRLTCIAFSLILNTNRNVQDLPWSQIDMEQLWGRVHRHGQTKPTWAFRLIAMKTFDEWMHAGGTGKVSLANEFLSRPANAGKLHRTCSALYSRAHSCNASGEGWYPRR